MAIGHTNCYHGSAINLTGFFDGFIYNKKAKQYCFAFYSTIQITFYCTI